MNLKTSSDNIDNLRRLVREVPFANKIFQGLRSEQSLAPDNIIFYRRAEKSASKSEGVSNNYHHRFEFVIVAEGSGPVRIDQTSYQLQPGECALIFPNQFHHYLDLKDTQAEWLFLTFEIRNPQAIQGLRDAPRVLDGDALHLVEHIVGEFLHPTGDTPDALSISYHLSRLLLHLLTCPVLPEERRDIHSGTSARDVILEKINLYVSEHLNQAVTISNIAEELGYSVSHLRAVFRDRLGVSLGRYMRESRLSEAAQLLQTSDLNVSAIGERCGFESLYAFSRAFRKAYGIPPRAYRQLVLEGTAPPPRRQHARASAV
jgi:AraC-like DNA-binding protein